MSDINRIAADFLLQHLREDPHAQFPTLTCPVKRYEIEDSHGTAESFQQQIQSQADSSDRIEVSEPESVIVVRVCARHLPAFLVGTRRDGKLIWTHSNRLASVFNREQVAKISKVLEAQSIQNFVLPAPEVRHGSLQAVSGHGECLNTRRSLNPNGGYVRWNLQKQISLPLQHRKFADLHFKTACCSRLGILKPAPSSSDSRHTMRQLFRGSMNLSLCNVSQTAVRNESPAEVFSLHRRHCPGYDCGDRAVAVRLCSGSVDRGTANGCGLLFVDFLLKSITSESIGVGHFFGSIDENRHICRLSKQCGFDGGCVSLILLRSLCLRMARSCTNQESDHRP